MIKVELAGLKMAQRQFQKALNDVEDYSAKAVVDIALDLLGKSVLQAPVDTGDLRGSGLAKVNGVQVGKGTKEGGIKATRPNLKSRNMTAEIGFYGLPYTVRQHEDTTLNHPQGGNAKFLEKPFKENTAKYIKYLSNSVKKGVGD